jgi:shikimate kinase
MLTSPSAFRIHLRTSPAVALARLQDDHSRPLLQGGKTERMHALIEERLPDYDLADREVVTDGRSIAEVVEVLAALVRSEGGWG